jgi:hypothetical protein
MNRCIAKGCQNLAMPKTTTCLKHDGRDSNLVRRSITNKFNVEIWIKTVDGHTECRKYIITSRNENTAIVSGQGKVMKLKGFERFLHGHAILIK